MAIGRSKNKPRQRQNPSRGASSRRKVVAGVVQLGSRNGGNSPSKPNQPALQFRWADAISEKEWAVYRSAMETLRQAKIPFLLGGGFALAAFTGRWRDTKDIDFYIWPHHRQAVIDALTRAGFQDLYSRLPYDRNWIYRSTQSGVIVDIIWSMANQRAQVDAAWFNGAGNIGLRNQQLLVVPLEEFIWSKLYILQRDHCDWTDIFNLLYACGSQVHWNHLLERLEEDLPLLRSLLLVYAWLCPPEALRLPRALWKRLKLCAPEPSRQPPKRNRVRLLDTRGWFAAVQPPDYKLEI